MERELRPNRRIAHTLLCLQPPLFTLRTAVILPTTTVVRAPEQISGTLDDRAVLLSIENGEYYQMNRMATRVWAAVEHRECGVRSGGVRVSAARQVCPV